MLVRDIAGAKPLDLLVVYHSDGAHAYRYGASLNLSEDKGGGVKMNLFNLTGKVAVITGGNRGIGLGMAEGIASLGANIVIAGRDAEAAAIALTTLRALGVKAEFIYTDVTKKVDCQALIDRAEDRKSTRLNSSHG